MRVFSNYNPPFTEKKNLTHFGLKSTRWLPSAPVFQPYLHPLPLADRYPLRPVLTKALLLPHRVFCVHMILFGRCSLRSFGMRPASRPRTARRPGHGPAGQQQGSANREAPAGCAPSAPNEALADPSTSALRPPATPLNTRHVKKKKLKN